MGFCVSFLYKIGLPDIVILPIQIVFGAVIYIGGAKLLKIDSFEFILSILNKYYKNDKN